MIIHHLLESTELLHPPLIGLGDPLIIAAPEVLYYLLHFFVHGHAAHLYP